LRGVILPGGGITPHREDVQRTNLSGIFKLNSVFQRTISCDNKFGFNLKIPDTAKEIMYFKINLLCIIELINQFKHLRYQIDLLVVLFISY
jgi:hypothetical protein